MKMHTSRKDVEVIEFTITEIESIVTQPVFLNGPYSFIFGLMWFLFNNNN